MQENDQPPANLTLSARGKLLPHGCVGAPVVTFYAASPLRWYRWIGAYSLRFITPSALKGLSGDSCLPEGCSGELELIDKAL